MAEETLRLATALRMAKAKPEAFKRYVRDLQRQAKPARRHAEEVALPQVRPEVAAWFEANRIPHQVITP